MVIDLIKNKAEKSEKDFLSGNIVEIKDLLRDKQESIDLINQKFNQEIENLSQEFKVILAEKADIQEIESIIESIERKADLEQIKLLNQQLSQELSKEVQKVH